LQRYDGRVCVIQLFVAIVVCTLSTKRVDGNAVGNKTLIRVEYSTVLRRLKVAGVVNVTLNSQVQQKTNILRI
jgi:hypothetical protein